MDTMITLAMTGPDKWLFGGVFAALYFLPTIISIQQGRRDTGMIVWLNLLLGWSVYGWIWAMRWACGK